MRIDITKIAKWKIASKTRPIKAKPLSNLLVDRTVTSKFLVDTLEGREPLGDGVVICIGEAGDIWQQMPSNLLKKYSVRGIDKDGWMECEPLPNNAVNCIEITGDLTAMGKFSIIGHYGAVVDGVNNVQCGEQGDFLCQSRNDPTDVWIVRRNLFLNTYIIAQE